MLKTIKAFIVENWKALGLAAWCTLWLGLNVLNMALFTALYFALLLVIKKITGK